MSASLSYWYFVLFGQNLVATSRSIPMSDFQVWENEKNCIMKTFFKSFVKFVVCGFFLVSCQKEPPQQHNEDEQLQSRADFRQYVANDLYSRVQFAGYLSGKLNAARYGQLRADLAVASEAALPAIFSKYRLDYALFQQHIIERIAHGAQMVHTVPSLARLSEQQIDQRFNESYQKVAAGMMQQVKERMAALKNQEGRKGVDFAGYSTQNRVEVLGINTGLENEGKPYFSTGNEMLLPEGEAVDKMAVYINQLTKKENITGAEVWKCFRTALGFGAASMATVAGWFKGTAGISIQEVIAVTTRWAVRHIGWIGAAITIISFADCLYGVQ